jgi:hypothetical protein
MLKMMFGGIGGYTQRMGPKGGELLSLIGTGEFAVITAAIE